MEITVKRTIKSSNSTVSDFYIDGQRTYYGLEPVDRGLHDDMTLDQIKAIKVQNKPAIPTGRYRVTRQYSLKHRRDVPLINDVKGFGGVEIHIGNCPKDTEGCLLLGTDRRPDEVLNSKAAIDAFYRKFFDTVDGDEMVFITFED